MGLITIAGGYVDKILIPEFLYLEKFIPSIEDFEYAKKVIAHRYSIYSNADEIFFSKTIKRLRHFTVI